MTSDEATKKLQALTIINEALQSENEEVRAHPSPRAVRADTRSPGATQLRRQLDEGGAQTSAADLEVRATQPRVPVACAACRRRLPALLTGRDRGAERGV